MYNEFLANIYFLTEYEGGRKTNIPKSLRTYRPLLYYKKNNYHCQIDLENIEVISLGNTYQLKIKILDVCPIKIGDIFELRELSTIGRGKILCQV